MGNIMNLPDVYDMYFEDNSVKIPDSVLHDFVEMHKSERGDSIIDWLGLRIGDAHFNELCRKHPVAALRGRAKNRITGDLLNYVVLKNEEAKDRFFVLQQIFKER